MVMISLANSRAALVAGSIAAGAAFLGAGALVTSPALAGQKAIKVATTERTVTTLDGREVPLDPVTLTTNCKDYMRGVVLFANTDCELLKGKLLQRQNKALVKESKALAKESKALAKESKALAKESKALDRELIAKQAELAKKQKKLVAQEATNACLFKIKEAKEVGKVTVTQLKKLGLAKGNSCSVLAKLNLG